MDILVICLPVILGIFGCIVGSFLNVVTLRQGTEKDLGGRSHCPTCGNQLSWYELIPVISFLIQRAKCRNCKTSISVQYVAVELFTGLLFYMGAKFFVMNFSAVMHPVWFFLQLFLLILIMSYLVLIIVYDLRTKKVPLVWFISLVISSFLYLGISYATSGFLFGWYNIWFHISGIVIALPFFIMWIVSKGAWMGFADIEIIAWMGMFLGIYSGASATLIAFYTGALFAIVFVGFKLSKGYSYDTIRKIHIPFTPFLLLAWFGTFIFSFDIFSLLSGLFM